MKKQSKVYSQEELDAVISLYVYARNEMFKGFKNELNQKCLRYCVVCSLLGLAIGSLITAVMM